jgi:ubiquitin-activating enzyme E1
VVTMLEDHRHGLSTGDMVVFEEIEGMTALNGTAPRPIKNVGPFSFSIDDTSGLLPYAGGGRFTQVKMPVTVAFQPLEQQLVQPTLLDAPDMVKMDMPAQQHCWWQALSQFQATRGRLPRPNTWDDAREVVEITKQVMRGGADGVLSGQAKLFACVSCVSSPHVFLVSVLNRLRLPVPSSQT